MKAFADRKIKHLFCMVFLSAVGSILFSTALIGLKVEYTELYVLGLSVYMGSFAFTAMYLYLRDRHKTMKKATAQIKEYIGGNEDARIYCGDEGKLYRLFHGVNSLVSILSTHAENEEREGRFMKGTISDISHQLETPLTTLSIYSGTTWEDARDAPAIRELVALLKQELGRIEMFVQNLLKITKLDTGTITLEKTVGNVSGMMINIERRFTFQAGQGGKTLSFFGDDIAVPLCDRNWLTKATSNVMKNALDRTKAGNPISVKWRSFVPVVQIVVEGSSNSTHPGDIHYIPKRLYRSHFSKDTRGVGPGLPPAKAIVEAHRGTIKVDSVLGTGMVFTINFLIPTKL